MYLNLRAFASLLVLSIAGFARCDLVPALVPIMPPTTLGAQINSVNWCTCRFLAAGGLIGSFPNMMGIIGFYQFNQTNESLSLTGTATLGINVQSISWCPSCSFLAAGGQTSDSQGIIQIYSFNPSHPDNLAVVVGSTITPGGNSPIFSIDWCPSCTVFAASFEDFSQHVFEIQAYSFDPNNPGNPVPIGDPVKSDAEVDSIKWCGDCQYLAGVDLNGNLTIYSLDPVMGLEFTTSVTSNASYTTVDWCMSCSYIAAGGSNDSGGIVDIYKFDPQMTPSLSWVTTATISSDSLARSLAWCQGCDNLAIGSFDFGTQQGILQLYHFDPVAKILSLMQPQSLGATVPLSLDWCGNCCELAVGGFLGQDLTTTGIIQLFRGNPCGLSAPTNLRAQKICHRFPTQVDIINKLCWDTVTGAVAYNVYADAALKILLVTIPSPTLCYSQHQICSLLRQGFGGQDGKSATYYVTTVKANGAQSAPAVVTI